MLFGPFSSHRNLEPLRPLRPFQTGFGMISALITQRIPSFNLC